MGCGEPHMRRRLSGVYDSRRWIILPSDCPDFFLEVVDLFVSCFSILLWAYNRLTSSCTVCVELRGAKYRPSGARRVIKRMNSSYESREIHIRKESNGLVSDGNGLFGPCEGLLGPILTYKEPQIGFRHLSQVLPKVGVHCIHHRQPPAKSVALCRIYTRRPTHTFDTNNGNRSDCTLVNKDVVSAGWLIETLNWCRPTSSSPVNILGMATLAQLTIVPT
ncbi:hypothetical protein PM082_004295 [Marasmius tenuissimus]|nr:hypothetical protein PM082_004295 [Marasmius tenuissimus]